MAKKLTPQAKASAVLALANKNLAAAQKAVDTATKRLLKQTHLAEAEARLSLEKALNKAAHKAEDRKALALKKMKTGKSGKNVPAVVVPAVVVPAVIAPATTVITVAALRAEAKTLGVTGYGRMTKAALIDAIAAAR